MKFPVKIFVILAVCVAAWTVGSLRAQDDIGAAPPPPDTGAPGNAGSDQGASFQTFYDALASQGTWIQSGDYGYVWQPTVSDPDWAPYTAGHWVYTDDGWTWVSDEPWGWATYHYGRWANLEGTGWCWVPGYTWAPAWVSWRFGGDYCGWAPLPPDSFVGIDYSSDGSDLDIGFHIGGDCDSFYGIGAGCYNFLPILYLGSSNYRGHYARRFDNFSIINRTTNVTSINVTRNTVAGRPGTSFQNGRFHRVVTGGPSLAQVNAVSQTPVQRVNLVRSNQPGGGVVANNSLALFAPRVNSAASPDLKPAHVGKALDHATINRGTDVTKPLLVNERVVPPTLTPGEIQRAQLAQFNAPIRAKVVTADMPVKPILEGPLTSLKPVSAVTTTPPRAPNTIPNQERAPAFSTPAPATPARINPGEEGGSTRVYAPAGVYQTPSTASPHYAPSGTPGGATAHPSAPATSPPNTSPAPSGGYRSTGGGSGGGASSGGGGDRGASAGGWNGSSGNGQGTQGQGGSSSSGGFGGGNGQSQHNH